MPTDLQLAACPKRMQFGPCGGVGSDGACEVADHPCVFLDSPPRRWEGAVPAAQLTAPAAALAARLERGAVVVADLPARAVDMRSLDEVAAVLRGRVDAVLAGDSPRERVQFPPSLRAVLLRERGLEPWIGVNARDRNRVALEGEFAGLAVAGAAGVHVVTGDHTDRGARPDAAPVFDLDATRMAALARAAGHLVSVAAAPAAPPRHARAAALLEKLRAGADVCFVDHCGGVEPAIRFVAEARALGAQCRFVACVPVVVDAGSAALLASFPGLVLPDGLLDEVAGSNDPRRAGIARAVDMASGMLDAGVDGVNLSGGPAAGAETRFAEALAEVADRLR